MANSTLLTFEPYHLAPRTSFWDLSKLDHNNVDDLSGNGNNLTSHGNFNSMNLGDSRSPALLLDGKSQWLTTNKPVIHTNKNFTVTAWVRLTINSLTSDTSLKDGINAITAISQESKDVSAFHLGIRSQNDGKYKTPPKWCFTVSPAKGDHDVYGCQDAFSNSYIDNTMLEKWFFLAGVCNYDNWETQLHIPQLNEVTTTVLPEAWLPWDANKKTVVGRGKWEGKDVDLWPGYIRFIECYSKALCKHDIINLYNESCSLFL